MSFPVVAFGFRRGCDQGGALVARLEWIAAPCDQLPEQGAELERELGQVHGLQALAVRRVEGRVLVRQARLDPVPRLPRRQRMSEADIVDVGAIPDSVPVAAGGSELIGLGG